MAHERREYHEYQSTDAYAVYAIQKFVQRRSAADGTADAEFRTDKSAAVSECGADGESILTDVYTRRPKVITNKRQMKGELLWHLIMIMEWSCR